MPFKIKAHIYSLNGEIDEITVLEQIGDNDYIVEYKGVKCHAHVFEGCRRCDRFGRQSAFRR